MKSRIRYLKYYFIAAFAVISVGITAFQLLYVIPMKKCEAAQNWWSWKYRKCYTPLSLPTLTGRPVGDKGEKQVDIQWHDRKPAQ